GKKLTTSVRVLSWHFVEVFCVVYNSHGHYFALSHNNSQLWSNTAHCNLALSCCRGEFMRPGVLNNGKANERKGRTMPVRWSTTSLQQPMACVSALLLCLLLPQTAAMAQTQNNYQLAFTIGGAVNAPQGITIDSHDN